MVEKPSKKDIVSTSEALRKESEEIRILRNETSRLRKALRARGAMGALIIDSVEQALDQLPQVVCPPKPKAKPRKREREVAVLHVSDWQWGKITSTYDSDIASRRVEALTERVLAVTDRRRAFARIDEIRVYLGGDMVEGEEIFPGQAHLIDQGVMDQAVGSCPESIVSMLLRCLSSFSRVKVLAVPGNHGRPGSRGGNPHPKTNWDTVCYRVAQMMLERSAQARKRVEWCISEDFFAVDDVLGHKNLIVHGHQIRGKFNGIGLDRKMSGWADAIPEGWRNLYFGHFHQYSSGAMNTRNWYLNGTLESTNEYALEELGACGEPIQRLQFFNADHGMVADCPIYLRGVQ